MPQIGTAGLEPETFPPLLVPEGSSVQFSQCLGKEPAQVRLAHDTVAATRCRLTRSTSRRSVPIYSGILDEAAVLAARDPGNSTLRPPPNF